MIRRMSLLLIILLPLIPTSPSPVHAQDLIQARTFYAVTVYSLPNRASPIVGVWVPEAKLIVEARDDSSDWVLARSLDGIVRGWSEARFLLDLGDSQRENLPTSTERMFVYEGYDTRYEAINLYDYPVVPANLGEAAAIYQAGQRYGMNAHNVSRVGDCISESPNFLSPFGWGEYSLGNYANLQPVIDQFGVSFTYTSHSAYDGLVTTAALDPIFANPLACQPGESPVRCEYRVHRPSVAVIMFGAQDLLFTRPSDFDENLRRIVHETMQAGVVPLLSTFPGNINQWDGAIQYNQIVVQVALDYDVPLLNLWRALYELPNHGLDEDGRHLSAALTSAGDMVQPNLQRGYPQRNLVTLLALDAVWRGAMN